MTQGSGTLERGRDEALDGGRGGLWPWLGQRVTAVVILVTIAVHLVLTHYVAIGELSYDNVAERLAGTAVFANDLLLLLAATFHALNGVRMVVLDYALSGSGGRRALDLVLWLAGIATVTYGTWALWVWAT